jgi:hypothetical protein
MFQTLQLSWRHESRNAHMLHVINTCTMKKPPILSSRSGLWVPGVNSGRSSIIGLIGCPRTRQILPPWLRPESSYLMATRGESALTAFQGGLRDCITASSWGGFLRICDIHACHSGGTWDTLYSCCGDGLGRRSRVIFEVEEGALEHSQPIGVDLSRRMDSERALLSMLQAGIPGSSSQGFRFSK